MDVRLAKVAQLRDLGVDPYGQRFPDTEPIDELLTRVPAEGDEGPAATAAGRVMGRRGHGKLYFLDLHDRTGRIQIHLSKNAIGEETLALI